MIAFSRTLLQNGPMIHFTLEQNGTGPFIAAWDATGITVGGRRFTSSLLLTPTGIHPWTPHDIEGMTEEDLDKLLAHPADVYLLGTGQRQRFPSVELLRGFYRRGIAIEVMDSGAACRTFNILSAEGRRAVAGIVIEG